MRGLPIELSDTSLYGLSFFYFVLIIWAVVDLFNSNRSTEQKKCMAHCDYPFPCSGTCNLLFNQQADNKALNDRGRIIVRPLYFLLIKVFTKANSVYVFLFDKIIKCWNIRLEDFVQFKQLRINLACNIFVDF